MVRDNLFESAPEPHEAIAVGLQGKNILLAVVTADVTRTYHISSAVGAFVLADMLIRTALQLVAILASEEKSDVPNQFREFVSGLDDLDKL